MTGPSVSCQTCKNRRIKCDGVKPVCQRCVKSKRVCITPPATKQLSFSIHVENSYASGKSKRPRGPRSRLTVDQSQVDLETRALAYYFQYHLQVIPEAPVTTGSLTECVVAWKSSEMQDQMVDLALSSMAIAVYSRVQNISDWVTEAASRYCRLLRLVQTRINKARLHTLSEQDVDACLLTVFLMGRYEAVIHQYDFDPQPIHHEQLQCLSHHEGVMAILEVWKEMNHVTASEIVKHTRRGQLRSGIMRNRPLPDWLLDGSCFGERGYDLEYDRILVRTIALRQALTCARQKQDVEIAEIKSLDQEAQNIDEALLDWMEKVSEGCPRQQHTVTMLDPFPKPHFYSREVHSCSAIGHAGVWTQYYGARMLIKSTHLKVYELGSTQVLMHCPYRPQRLECKSQLNTTADALASIVPFCLEKIKRYESGQNVSVTTKAKDVNPSRATMLVWPLTIASCLEGIDPEQRKWFRSELASAGRLLGDGVLSKADTEAFPFSF